MKNIFSSLLAMALLGLAAVSCQNDSTGSDKLSKNSPLTVMLMRATHGGAAVAGRSGDDDLPCFTVNLPVVVTVNGTAVTVSDMADYGTVLNALHHSGDDEGDDDNGTVYSFVYPITLTLADGTSQTIASGAELQTAIHNCSDDLDDIDCLDVHFPITFTFTDATNVTTTITLNDDDEVYTFLATLGGSETFVISYPMTITDSTGATLVINSNDELLTALQNADDDCGHHDGDDDNGGDDNGGDDNGGDGKVSQ